MSEDKKSVGGQVIHVHFGPGGGRRTAPPPPAPEPKAGPPPRPGAGSARALDAYGELFTRTEVARLFGLTVDRLRRWDRQGLLSPSAKASGRRFYTFQDLVGVRAAKELLDRGLPLSSVRRSLESLGRTLPHVTRPLSELRIVADGQTLVVHDQERRFEAETGQLQLDFELRALRDDVVRVLRPERIDPERRRRAYDAYLEGCRLDEDESGFAHAEQCYREAIALDPTLANALTNWGNLRFRQGDVEQAESLYRRALQIDDEQPGAFYNLGFLAFDRGEMEEAVRLFAHAAEHDPGFADAHFNLAMSLEECGRSAEARAHWVTYLELDPDGPWARIAARHLDR